MYIGIKDKNFQNQGNRKLEIEELFYQYFTLSKTRDINN